MQRAIETARSIEHLHTSLAHLSDKFDNGFERMGGAMERMTAMVERHDRALEALANRDDRNRAIVRWVASIAATVVAALVLIVFGVRLEALAQLNAELADSEWTRPDVSYSFGCDPGFHGGPPRVTP